MCIHWGIGKVHYYVLSLAKGPRHCNGIFLRTQTTLGKRPISGIESWNAVTWVIWSFVGLQKTSIAKKQEKYAGYRPILGLPILRAPQVMCLQSSHLQNLFPGLLSNQDWPGGRLPHSTSLWPPMLEAKRFLPQILRNVSFSVIDK